MEYMLYVAPAFTPARHYACSICGIRANTTTAKIVLIFIILFICLSVIGYWLLVIVDVNVNVNVDVDVDVTLLGL